MLRRPTRYLFWLFTFAALVSSTSTATAQGPSPLKFRENNKLEANGDAFFSYEIRLPQVLYTKLKQVTPNTAVMLRKFGLTNEGMIVENMKGSWDDGESLLKIEFNSRGISRASKDLRWEFPLFEGIEAELVAFSEGTAVLTQSMNIPGLGLATNTIRIKMPEGSSDLKPLKNPSRLSYKLDTPIRTEGEAKVDFSVETKEQVMSSLAKALSNKSFAALWTSRTKFKNVGQQTIKDYRVRFRVAEYAPTWSPWQGTPIVVAGQTVMDTYFPIFENERLAKMTGQTKVSLEVQWQYKAADGKLVEDSETKEFILLSRNQVYYTSMKFEDCVDWNDQDNLSQFVLSSFVSHEDPVIQQAAGRIAKWAGGANALKDDAEAQKYMKAAYLFMAENIAYQTPPANENAKKFLQHVKYGRDVLKNKAGTCIDLAILYGSLCQAVGLEPVLYNIPGHCFPAVKMPSGRIVPIEATTIGQASFEDSNKIAMKNNYGPMMEGKIAYTEISINQMQKLGALPIDLPNVGEDPLEKWGIKMPGANVQGGGNMERQPNNGGGNGGGGNAPQNQKSMVGTWRMSVNFMGGRISQAIEFKANGTFQATSRAELNGMTSDVSDTGKWALEGNRLTIVGDETGTVVRSIKMAADGDSCDINMAELGGTVKFTRVK
jgi:Transglutaminase-like superfamily